MNYWIIGAIIAGILLLAGVLVNSQSVSADANSESCTLGSAGCPYQGQGGCTQGSNCGLDTCAAKFGGGCGCGGAR